MSLLWKHDLKAVKGHSHLIGVDEAGRGPLAGPVVAAAVALCPEFFKKASHRKNTSQFDDSKKIPEPRRIQLFDWLEKAQAENRLKYAWAEAGIKEIESYNIFQATARTMKRAIANLPQELQPRTTTSDLPLFQARDNNQELLALLLVDGKPMKRIGHPHRAIIKGDGTSLSIAMASIIAKTIRDRLMTDLDKVYPQYGFATHKGYGTPQHIAALRQHGSCPEHRPRFLRNLDL